MMVSERPDINPSGRYTQAAAARLMGVDRHTISRWSRDPSYRLERFVRRAGGGTYYLGKDLLRIWEAYN